MLHVPRFRTRGCLGLIKLMQRKSIYFIRAIPFIKTMTEYGRAIFAKNE